MPNGPAYAIRTRGHMRNDRLIAVHICRICNAATAREQVNPESMISGLVKCTQCGSESDLNIEIIERPDVPRPPP